MFVFLHVHYTCHHLTGPLTKTFLFFQCIVLLSLKAILSVFIAYINFLFPIIFVSLESFRSLFMIKFFSNHAWVQISDILVINLNYQHHKDLWAVFLSLPLTSLFWSSLISHLSLFTHTGSLKDPLLFLRFCSEVQWNSFSIHTSLT